MTAQLYKKDFGSGTEHGSRYTYEITKRGLDARQRPFVAWLRRDLRGGPPLTGTCLESDWGLMYEMIPGNSVAAPPSQPQSTLRLVTTRATADDRITIDHPKAEKPLKTKPGTHNHNGPPPGDPEVARQKGLKAGRESDWRAKAFGSGAEVVAYTTAWQEGFDEQAKAEKKRKAREAKAAEVQPASVKSRPKPDIFLAAAVEAASDRKAKRPKKKAATPTDKPNKTDNRKPRSKTARSLTPEQHQRKILADRARRARIKAEKEAEARKAKRKR